LEALIRGNALKYGNGISLHPYFHCRPNASPEAWYSWLKRALAKAEAANGHQPVKFYLTEMGWPTNKGKCGRSERSAESVYARTNLLAKTLPSVHGLWWYELRDQSWDKRERQHNFGVIRPDGSRKPAFESIRALSQLVRRGQFVRRIQTDSPTSWVLEFQLDGQLQLVYWAETGSAKITLPYDLGTKQADDMPRLVAVRKTR
jgi:endo-1,4-beta-mannosidase